VAALNLGHGRAQRWKAQPTAEQAAVSCLADTGALGLTSASVCTLAFGVLPAHSPKPKRNAHHRCSQREPPALNTAQPTEPRHPARAHGAHLLRHDERDVQGLGGQRLQHRTARPAQSSTTAPRTAGAQQSRAHHAVAHAGDGLKVLDLVAKALLQHPHRSRHRLSNPHGPLSVHRA
jgi:hypothetical protein